MKRNVNQLVSRFNRRLHPIKAASYAVVLLGFAVIGAVPAWAADADGDGMDDEYEAFFGLSAL